MVVQCGLVEFSTLNLRLRCLVIISYLDQHVLTAESYGVIATSRLLATIVFKV